METGDFNSRKNITAQKQPTALMRIVSISDITGANSKYLQMGPPMNGMRVIADHKLLLHDRVTLCRNINRNRLRNSHRKSMLLQTRGCNLRQSIPNFKTIVW